MTKEQLDRATSLHSRLTDLKSRTYRLSKLLNGCGISVEVSGYAREGATKISAYVSVSDKVIAALEAELKSNQEEIEKLENKFKEL